MHIKAAHSVTERQYDSSRGPCGQLRQCDHSHPACEIAFNLEFTLLCVLPSPEPAG